jgi:hypothetical protein
MPSSNAASPDRSVNSTTSKPGKVFFNARTGDSEDEDEDEDDDGDGDDNDDDEEGPSYSAEPHKCVAQDPEAGWDDETPEQLPIYLPDGSLSMVRLASTAKSLGLTFQDARDDDGGLGQPADGSPDSEIVTMFKTALYTSGLLNLNVNGGRPQKDVPQYGHAVGFLLLHASSADL